ncbi:47706c7b-ad31-4a35-93f1-f33c2c5b8199 [Thermothielavioides terrestris]|uniref:47706c7b-ad31-4a35-93f1-f33c2c5b8199 n=1 Tax=Thermothielavioides terrestris TaxID=2587410 RepID=A0A446BY09_9PEZI|nr:47706c7b-ad31-4a35-93f1-f33c2c5b8199 [Thermothielavioides terrestris]
MAKNKGRLGQKRTPKTIASEFFFEVGSLQDTSIREMGGTPSKPRHATPHGTGLCARCRQITFRPIKSMSVRRWYSYFDFLFDREDLADEYKARYDSFLRQIPHAPPMYEAILQPSYEALLASAASGTCALCSLLARLFLKIGRWSPPDEPGIDKYGGIVTYPPIRFPTIDEEDIDELRSASPVVWLEMVLRQHDPTAESLRDALEDAAVVVKTASLGADGPRFFITGVWPAERPSPLPAPVATRAGAAAVRGSNDKHTGSAAAVALARQWLDTCRAHHHLCKQQDAVQVSPNVLPTRLLDLGVVGKHDADDIALRTIRKDEDLGGSLEYATLSYRWGGPQPTATTTANLEQRHRRIRLRALPRLFREAIAFTRRMGVRYLWIDSFCIVQDSKADLVHEIPRMVDIYSHAVFNISANAASNPAAGLFSARSTAEFAQLEVPLRFILDGDDEKSSIAQHSFRAILSPGLVPDNTAPSVGAQDRREEGGGGGGGGGHLEQRGWIFQERAFSRRVFSFEQQMVWFECREIVAAENLPQGHSRTRRSSPAAAEKWEGLLPPSASRVRDLSGMSDHLFQARRGKDSDNTTADTHLRELYRDWYDAIPGYMSRTFTFEADRLPGISGLAREIHRLTSDTYLAGLWARELVRGLCWSVTGGGPQARRCRGPGAYRAPSWSWASLAGPCSIQYPSLPADADLGLVTVLAARTQPADGNAFGDVVSGEIRLRGRMKEARAWSVMEAVGGVEESYGRLASVFDVDTDWERSGAYLRGGFAQAYVEDVEDYKKAPVPVWVLPLVAFWPVVDGVRKGKKLCALVLREREDGTFVRAGFLWRLSRGSDAEWDDADEDGPESWFGNGCEERDVMIV